MATPTRSGLGSMPRIPPHEMAMGTIKTAAALLEIISVKIEVTTMRMASSATGPIGSANRPIAVPRISASPVCSKAMPRGRMVARRKITVQLIEL